MARKHIIAGLGQSDKKGATGQINYKSYFAKFFQILQKPVDYAGQRRIENLQMRRKSESAKEWMCEEKPSRWLYLYQLEARRRDLMHINWSPRAGLLRESCQISHLDFIRPLNWTASKTDKLDLLLTSTAVSVTHCCFFYASISSALFFLYLLVFFFVDDLVPNCCTSQ